MPVAKKGSRTQWPPVLIRDDETDAETKLRLNEEAEAKRISDEIDRQLEHEHQQRSKVVGPKILLLGSYHVSPSYSGLGHDLYHCRTGGIWKIYGSEELSTAFCAQSFRTRGVLRRLSEEPL